MDPERSVRGTERVMVVEDDDAVRRMLCRLLATYGYKTLGASTPAEAVEIAGSCQVPIDLLLTDVVMPQAHGKALHRQLLQSWPAIRVVYMSGYPDETFCHHGIREEGKPFMQKPFSAEALAREVRTALDR